MVSYTDLLTALNARITGHACHLVSIHFYLCMNLKNTVSEHVLQDEVKMKTQNYSKELERNSGQRS